MKLALCFFTVVATLSGAEPDATKLHAWYRPEGLKWSGAGVTAWESAVSPARPLSRIAGSPAALLVGTPGGERTVLRLDGKSALWQPANVWGSLAEGRTVVAFLRLSPNDAGAGAGRELAGRRAATASRQRGRRGRQHPSGEIRRVAGPRIRFQKDRPRHRGHASHRRRGGEDCDRRRCAAAVRIHPRRECGDEARPRVRCGGGARV